MDLKLELVLIPVTDVDRAKAFYTENLGFNLDVDTAPVEGFRVVQLTPPGSACSITIGTGITDAAPGSYRGTHLVVSDIEAARAELVGRGVAVSEVRHFDREQGQWQPGVDPDARRIRLLRRLQRSGRQHLGAAGSRLRGGLGWAAMDWKIELIAIPVSDVDRAKAFYTDQAGFDADHDITVSEDIRFVQLTPPGSACSITLGKGITDAPPGSVQGVQIVVSDIEAAHAELAGRGVEVSDVQDFPWGRVRLLRRSRRQPLGGAAAPAARVAGLSRAGAASRRPGSGRGARRG